MKNLKIKKKKRTMKDCHTGKAFQKESVLTEALIHIEFA